MAYIHQIFDFDVENDFGTGPVVSVFWNFCSFHCNGCWNPSTWERQEDLYMDNDELINRLNIALNEFGFQKDLSILGGDSMLPQNIEDTLYVIKTLKKSNPNLKIGVWTGFKWETLMRGDKWALQRECLKYVDYLIDGPFIQSKLVQNKRYGSWNQRVIDVQNSLSSNEIVLESQYALENKDHLTVDGVVFKSYKKEV